ncbi:uncharacterized protein LOC144122910 [Amblyomma americanum]
MRSGDASSSGVVAALLAAALLVVGAASSASSAAVSPPSLDAVVHSPWMFESPSSLFPEASGPQQRSEVAAGQPEARVFSSLLRVFEAAEWDKVFVKMARVVVNYFTDMAFKVLFGSTGSRRVDADDRVLRQRLQRRNVAEFVLERQQQVSRLPPDCQRRIACRVGQHFGNVHSLRSLAPILRTVDRSLVEAALHGLSHSDCDMAYPDCQLA